MSDQLRPLSESEREREIDWLQSQFEERATNFMIAAVSWIIGFAILLTPLDIPAPVRTNSVILVMLGIYCVLPKTPRRVPHIAALMQFGARKMPGWKRAFFYHQLRHGLLELENLASDELLDWDILARALRETRLSLLRIRILQFAARFGRVELLPIIEERYSELGLMDSRLSHEEAAALAQVRLVLRPLATLASESGPRQTEVTT